MTPISRPTAGLLAVLLWSALGSSAVAETPPPRSSPAPEPAQAVIAASSLVERVEAQQRLAAEERTFLESRVAEVTPRLAVAEARIGELESSAAERRLALSRLMQQAYRQSRKSVLEVFLESGSVVEALRHMDGFAALGDRERTVLSELRTLEVEQVRQRDTLVREKAGLDALMEGVQVKDATIAKLVARSQRLLAGAAAGRASLAEIEVIREVAEDAARASAETDRLVAEVASRAGITLVAPQRWVWPVQGTVTQLFGPTALALEPPRVYRGISYPNFHDGIDVGTALGAPVVAAARGRVAFVGHLSDGAMVVLMAHDAGFVTLYGHLDDAALAPRVRVGDAVEAGARIGAVGLTGLTTGPHLHFSVRLGPEVVDPRVLLHGPSQGANPLLPSQGANPSRPPGR